MEDLCLTFTVMEDGGGLIEKGREVDLVPGGKDISVTSSNRHKLYLSWIVTIDYFS